MSFRKMVCVGLASISMLFSTTLLANVDDAIKVKDNLFYKGGDVWIAEGVTIVGRVSPMSVARNKPAYWKARNKYGHQLLNDIKKFGADVIRFQVSQGGLDPKSHIHDSKYRDEVLRAIKETREAGFNVIVSMQWQSASGSPREGGKPSNATVRAWEQIIDPIASDKGVLLELFNEPDLRKPTRRNWKIWQKGTQKLIDHLRNMGAQNVLLVDGLRASHILNDAPQLKDPLNQTGYAVHPYLDRINQTREQWDKNFGNFADSHPVMATEFMADASRACRQTMPQETAELLSYLHEKKIGLVIWAFDLSNIKRNGKYTTFDELSCDKGNKRGGAGNMIHEYYIGK